jgi:hypothetical protein
MTHSNGTAHGQAFDVEKLAVSPTSPEKIPELLQRIASHGEDHLSGDQDPQARAKLLEAARSLTYALETPREAAIRHCWSEVGTPGVEVVAAIDSYNSSVHELCSA